MAEVWVDAGEPEDIDAEDVIRFDHGGKTYALYRTEDDRYFATDGLCTHEKIHLAGGLVMGTIIECPKHNGRFDVRTGEAVRLPAQKPLCTYPITEREGRLVATMRDDRESAALLEVSAERTL